MISVGEIGSVADTNLHDSEAVNAGALRLEREFTQGTPEEHAYLVGSLDQDTLSNLQAVYEQFETNLEYEHAEKILSGLATLEDYQLYDRFVRLIQSEANLAGIQPNQRLLFIGSGPFPISAILFAKLTGATVDCFDISDMAIETSEKVIRKLGLEDKINVINVAGQDGDASGYDAIVVALLAQPKRDIAWNLKTQNPEGVPVIMRYSEGDRTVFYRGFGGEALDAVTRYSFNPFEGPQHHAGPNDTISSTLGYVRRSIEKY